nr:hypothetical protein [uncultured Halomonas sp.]
MTCQELLEAVKKERIAFRILCKPQPLTDHFIEYGIPLRVQHPQVLAGEGVPKALDGLTRRNGAGRIVCRCGDRQPVVQGSTQIG